MLCALGRRGGGEHIQSGDCSGPSHRAHKDWQRGGGSRGGGCAPPLQQNPPPRALSSSCGGEGEGQVGVRSESPSSHIPHCNLLEESTCPSLPSFPLYATVVSLRCPGTPNVAKPWDIPPPSCECCPPMLPLPPLPPGHKECTRQTPKEPRFLQKP